jgi:hypothetical protein
LRGALVLGRHGRGETGVIAQEADAEAALEGFGQRDGHAVLQGDGPGQFAGALFQRVGKAVDCRSALGRCAGGPAGMIEGLARRRNGTVHVRLHPLRHAAEALLGCGVDDVETPRRRGDPSPPMKKDLCSIPMMQLLLEEDRPRPASLDISRCRGTTAASGRRVSRACRRAG